MPEDLASPDVDQQLMVTTGAQDLDLLRLHGTLIVGNPFGVTTRKPRIGRLRAFGREFPLNISTFSTKLAASPMDTQGPIPTLPATWTPTAAARMDRTLGRILWVALGVALLMAS